MIYVPANIDHRRNYVSIRFIAHSDACRRRRRSDSPRQNINIIQTYYFYDPIINNISPVDDRPDLHWMMGRLEVGGAVVHACKDQMRREQKKLNKAKGRNISTSVLNSPVGEKVCVRFPQMITFWQIVYRPVFLLVVISHSLCGNLLTPDLLSCHSPTTSSQPAPTQRRRRFDLKHIKLVGRRLFYRWFDYEPMNLNLTHSITLDIQLEEAWLAGWAIQFGCADGGDTDPPGT